jgi:hypothetical protein
MAAILIAGMLNGYFAGGLKQIGFQAALRVLVPCRFMAPESLVVEQRQCTQHTSRAAGVKAQDQARPSRFLLPFGLKCRARTALRSPSVSSRR